MATVQLTVEDATDANGRPSLNVTCTSSEAQNNAANSNIVLRYIAKHWDALVFAARLESASALVSANSPPAGASADPQAEQQLKLLSPNGGFVTTGH